MTGASLSLRSKAPTRIDLAGGTVDLWPLYLFLKNPCTINLGINLFAETELSLFTSPPAEKVGSVEFFSTDQKSQFRFSLKDLSKEKETAHPSVKLHTRLFDHFVSNLPPENRRVLENAYVTLSTRALSPAGAGLGGSSTLSVSMIGALGALGQWLKTKDIAVAPSDSWIETVRDIETTVIDVPAGLQDYFGAMYGGLQLIHWLPEWHRRESLSDQSPDLLAGLQDRLILFYSGHSRNSGINNWALFKAFIDKDLETRSHFSQIVDATHSLETALRAKDWKGVGVAIQKEWAARKQLASGITTAEIDQAIATASRITPLASKICGAGGGGCFFMYLEKNDPELKSKVVSAVQELGCGVVHLPFKAVPHGLKVEAI